MSFTMTQMPKQMAMAVALATGSVLAMSGAIAEPVQAQKKAKKEYSEAFIAAYNPISDALKAEGTDIASVVAMVPGLIAVSKSADELFVTGNTAYSVGLQSSNKEMQLDGMKMMLESGQMDIDKIGQYNFIGFQLARDMNDHTTSRTYLQRAIDNNFTTAEINPSVMKIEMAETFFRDNRFKEGLQLLGSELEARQAAGSAIEESWYRRGLSVGYKNEVKPEIFSFLNSWIAAFPTNGNWRDAVNITRQLNEYGAPETLDIMRLGFRLDTLQDTIEYIDYVESADPRRLPKEVQAAIQNGYSTGRVSRDDTYLADSLQQATRRISDDKAELPALARDARLSSASIRTVLAAGDAFLNYEDYVKAEEFYSKALGMAGVDTAQTLTRLGIAQTELGKLAEAKATFAKVQGARVPIAQLWSTYVDTKMALPAAPAIAVPPAS